MLLIALGRIGQLFLMLATIKVSTALLAPTEMAKVYLLTSIISFYAMLLVNPVGMFMNRRIHAWNDAGKIKLYYRYYWVYLIIVCCIAVTSLYFIIFAEVINVHTNVGWALLLVGGSLLITSINQLFIPGLNLLNHRGWFVLLTLATAGVSLLISLSLIVGIEARAEYWLTGLLLGQLILAGIGKVIFSRKTTPPSNAEKPGKPHVKVLMAFAWPISVAVGMGWVQSQSYRFMMESSLGLHAVGLFVAGYGVSLGLISAFEMVFMTYLQPILYKGISNNEKAEQSKAWCAYAGALFPSMILVGFFVYAAAPELTHVLLGSAFQSSSEFIVWGVVAELARVASGVYGMVAHARMKTQLLLMPGLVGAVLSVALIWWLIPRYGSHGAGAALVLSALCSFALTYASTRELFATHLPARRLGISVAAGAGLIILAHLVRPLTSNTAPLFAALTALASIGSTFLFIQYILLRPILRRADA